MHVLVPIDDSDPARAAVEEAVTSFPEADITVLHVIEVTPGTYGDEVIHDFQRILELRKENAERLFETAREIAAEHDTEIRTETEIGSPRRQIVAYAEEEEVDHIILGSHGRTGLSRVLLGSVAESVVRRAPMPVTVVR